MHGLRKFWLPAILLGVGALCFSIAGTQHMLERALTREAASQGMDWAQYIENRLNQITELHNEDGTLDRRKIPTTEEFRGILSNVFDVGHIYQIDYINANCLCDISLSANNLGPSSTGHLPVGHSLDDGHDHGASLTEKISKGRLKHTFKSSGQHSIKPSATEAEGKYPIDRDLVRLIAANQTSQIYIRTGISKDHPSTFAEVFHPVSSNGEAIYILRVMVDMEEQALGYKRLMLMTSSFSGLILLLAIGFPARCRAQSLKQQRVADKRVKFLANHDVLTNLYNRNNFQESMSDILWTCHEKQQSALVFLFDLNGFKEVNDYHGHHAGDKLLCAFAALLKERTPEGGYIARLGGDEFVVVIGGLPAGPLSFSDYLNLPQTISMPIDRGNQMVTASIAGGVVRFPEDAQRTTDLMQMADLALYAAKPNRSGEICRYQPQMKNEFLDRLTLRDEFRLALEASQLIPFYQPIVNMRTGAVEAFEALARWEHPEKGILTPFVFEDIFEDAELSALLGQQMFEKIANDMEAWTAEDVQFHKVGLNVINGDLNREDFSASILEGLKQRGLAPSNLVIEITENCLFGRDKQKFLAHLQTLRDAGCPIALDDFGTGYSSITQLKELPVTSVKIDKSFIENILENEADKSIIGALLRMGNSMDFKLVLEGIETPDQLTFLRGMGFTLAQGYYYSKPVSAAEVPALIARQNAMHDVEGLHKKRG